MSIAIYVLQKNGDGLFCLQGNYHAGVSVIRAEIAHSIIKNNAVSPSVQAALLKHNAPSLLINAM